jgi:hypothetical protein
LGPSIRVCPSCPWLINLSLFTEKIIGCAFRVGEKLKCGFLEKVYENAERRIRPRATKKRPRTY